MAIAMQAVTGLRCLKESGRSVVCNSSPRECHIAVGNSSILPILGCGQTPFSGNGLGCRRANSATVYCACNTDNCNTFASTKQFLRDERQGQTCKTTNEGSGRRNTNCELPWKFNGKLYNGCTTDTDPDGRFWCSTKINNRQEHDAGSQNWG